MGGMAFCSPTPTFPPSFSIEGDTLVSVMSTSHSTKRKRTESVEPVAESSKRTRSTAKSTSKPSEPITTPRSSRSKQKAPMDTVDHRELVVEERTISLRSKEITTPIQRRVRRQQETVTGDSSAADSDSDAWEGMDVEESSVSGSEMSTPAKRLYARNSSSAAGVLPSRNRRSLPAVVSAHRAPVDDSASIDDASEAGSVASRRSSRRASFAGGVSSRATSGAGSTALALLAAEAAAGMAGTQTENSRGPTSSSSAAAGSRARRGKAGSATATQAAAQGPGGSNTAHRQAPPSSSSSSASSSQPVAPPAAAPAADQARQGGAIPAGPTGQVQPEDAEEEAAEAPAADRDLPARWRSYVGVLLVLLVSAAVAYCLAGAAFSVVSVRRASPDLSVPLSAATDRPELRQAIAPPSAVRDVDVEALLQRVDAEIKAHLASIRATQSMTDSLQDRTGKVNASSTAAIGKQAAVTADTEVRLHGLLSDLDALQGNASAFTASAAAHLNKSASLASQLAADGASAAAALADKVQGELASNVSSADARSEELVGLLSSELRALAQRTGALTSRRGAQTGLSGIEEEALSPLSTANASHLLDRAQQTSAVLAAHAEASSVAVDSDLPLLVEALQAVVNGTAGRLEGLQRGLERDKATYEDQQLAAIGDVRTAAEAAAERAQAEVDEAVARAVSDASAAVASVPVGPRRATRDVRLGPEESDERIRQLADELLSERVEQKRSEATDSFESDVAAQTEAVLRSAEEALRGQLEKESQLEALLHRTGDSHSNLGLESFREALWEVEGAEAGEGQGQGQLQGENSPVGEGRILQGEGEAGTAAGIRLERGQMARMHDFAVGVRGGRAVHHRVLCHAGGGLRLTSPPASSAADGTNSLSSALLNPFRGVWGSLGSSNREDRGARHSAASGVKGSSQRRIAALPVTTVVSHIRPSPDSYYAMTHSDSAGSSRSVSNRRARSHRDAAFDYASSQKEALAQITVALHAPVNVTVLRVIHATASPHPAPPGCAPRTVRVLGWTEDPSKVRHLAGRVFDLGVLELGESVPCNAYPAAREGQKDSYVWERAALPPALVAGLSLPPLKAVTLQVLNSEGEGGAEAGFTCLHRVQVVGTMLA